MLIIYLFTKVLNNNYSAAQSSNNFVDVFVYAKKPHINKINCFHYKQNLINPRIVIECLPDSFSLFY